MKIIKIGKANNNDIVITGDSTVSRLHMQIFIDDEGNVFVTDLSSLNGTFINGVKISDSVKLNTFDILKVGNSLINWKELLLDNSDAKDAYKTIVDDDKQDLLDSLDDIAGDSNKTKRSKQTRSYILYIAAACILLGGLFVYFNSDKQLIIHEWVLKSDKNFSYIFNHDGTFIRDSSGVIKKGSYKLNNNILSLKYYKSSLPVFLKKLKIYSEPNNNWGNKEGRVVNEYFGNTFNLKNKSKYNIKIISASTTTFKNDKDLNVNTKVYSLDSDYILKIDSNDEVDISEWNLVSNIYNDVLNGAFNSEIILDNCFVKPKSKSSFMIISNISARYRNGIGTAGSTISSFDKIIDVSEGHASSKINDKYYLSYNPRNWNGNIVYGLMQEDFDYSYNFMDEYLEIDDVLFEKK